MWRGLGELWEKAGLKCALKLQLLWVSHGYGLSLAGAVQVLWRQGSALKGLRNTK